MEELLTTTPASEPLRRRQATVVSPLRYPGGKRRLVGYIAEALRLNRLRPQLFIEPFAGGANVALQLLNDGLVENIALGEIDPLVSGFWKTLFHDTEWLIAQIRTIQPTLELWDEYRRANPVTERERALVCLVLNRTSFSGILSPTAGPIGGRKQESAYRIDCRFAAETLIKRINQIAPMRNRVSFIHQGDWQETIEQAGRQRMKKQDRFFYLDPPFYSKAERLYRYYFNEIDHRRLHDAMKNIKGNYIISYDPAEPICTMYSGNGIGPKQVELLYSATQPDKLIKAQELIISNLLQLPIHTRLWMTSREWHQG